MECERFNFCLKTSNFEIKYFFVKRFCFGNRFGKIDHCWSFAGDISILGAFKLMISWIFWDIDSFLNKI